MGPHGPARSTLHRRIEFCSVIIHKYSVFYFEKPSFYVKNTKLKHPRGDDYVILWKIEFN